MTRWARGGTANQKQPHEGTSWSNIKQSSDKSKKTEDGSSNKTHKTWKKTGSRFDTINKPAPELKRKRRNSLDGEQGLASQLEQVGQGPSSSSDEPSSKMAKSSKHSAGSSGLVDALNRLKEEMGGQLTSEQQTDMDNLIEKDTKREHRRLKRIEKRQNNQICFNCREEGHRVEDCPKLQQAATAGGICFKCGSTEHTVIKCRLKLPPGEFPFATCFICKEKGHMSKQCPDNPRGLYPKGGCCNICSSVEHYKKDCPEGQKKQGIEDWRLEVLQPKQSMDSDAFIEEQTHVKRRQKKNKIVTF